MRQVLDGDEAAFAEAAGDAFEAYNEAQMATARAPDTGAKVPPSPLSLRDFKSSAPLLA